MYTSIIRVKIKPGSEAAFEAMGRKLIATVAEKEPGALFYRFFRMKEPGRYCFVEAFADQDASKAHVASAHFQAVRDELFGYFDGPPEIDRLTDL